MVTVTYLFPTVQVCKIPSQHGPYPTTTTHVNGNNTKLCIEVTILEREYWTLLNLPKKELSENQESYVTK